MACGMQTIGILGENFMDELIWWLEYLGPTVDTIYWLEELGLLGYQTDEEYFIRGCNHNEYDRFGDNSYV